MTPTGTGQQRTITAFFESRQDANEAVQRLYSEGFSRDSVRLVEGSEGGQTTTTSERDVNPDRYRDTYNNNEGMGFWEGLKDLFLPDEDRSTYAEGLRRGGYLVTVTTRDANYERALDILDDEGTIDIDERASSWRSEGWTGYGGADRARQSARPAPWPGWSGGRLGRIHDRRHGPEHRHRRDGLDLGSAASATGTARGSSTGRK
jgi:hypothetical protein